MRRKSFLLVCSLAALTLAACSNRIETVMVHPAGMTKGVQPAGAEELITAGRGFLAKQNYGLAIAQFREALRFDPASAAAHNGLGIAYASIGRDDLAKRYFERAIGFASDNASYRRNFEHLAASGASDQATAANAALQALGQNEEQSSTAGYHLRQEDSSPVDRTSGLVLKVALPPAPDIAAADADRDTTADGSAQPLPTAQVPAPRVAAAPTASGMAASFKLERGRTADRSSSATPVLERLSSYEVRIKTMRSRDTLAQIMKRDFLADWETKATAPVRTPDADNGRQAFRGAIGNARKRIEMSLTIASGQRACARAMLISYARPGAGRGPDQCGS